MVKIDSRNNAKIKYITRLLNDSGFRKKEGKLAVENPVMLDEAIESDVIPESIFLSETAAEKEAVRIEKYRQICDRIFVVSDEIFRKISNLEAPQGVAAQIPASVMPRLKIKPNGRYVLLERVTDPGNIGTVIRTADAFAFDGVILTEGCADVYSPKVMRSTMGGIFRVPIATGVNTVNAVAELKKNKIMTAAAILDKTATELNKAEKTDSFAVMIGNEASGLSAEAAEAADIKLYIEMEGAAESLNAAIAAAIIMYTLQK